VATSRSQKKGSRLVVTVEPFKTILPEEREEIEVGMLAPYKNSLKAEIVFSGPP
jgi:hypothetical protein